MDYVILVVLLVVAGILHYISDTNQNKHDKYTGIKDDPQTDDFLPF